MNNSFIIFSVVIISIFLSACTSNESMDKKEVKLDNTRTPIDENIAKENGDSLDNNIDIISTKEIEKTNNSLLSSSNIELRNIGFKKLNNRDFVESIEETCQNEKNSEKTCTYNEIIDEYDYSNSDIQDIVVYQKDNIELRIKSETTYVETDELGSQPSYTKSLILIKDNNLSDSIEIYRNENLYYSQSYLKML